ncbi:MAG: PQQ-binding-like beta-propeller repeat protein [bacterium]|nr:PQQ-binding-like beta-propeller repeat protein [bacterium]
MSADWPQYRGDVQRTASRLQDVGQVAWSPGWTMVTGASASPTWPAPARRSLWQNLEQIEARVVHDRGDHPLLARDQQGKLHLLLALSGGDRVVAVDPVSGYLEWEFFADAPIRFAPATGHGMAWFGSDDGMLRALSIASGELIWETQVGPDGPWIVGNGRLIASHPIRTSVIEQNGMVFATAGLFPSQGVYGVALDALTGELIWRVRLEQSPQGYSLWADENRLVLPAGRAQPFMLDGESGEFLAQLPSLGGSFCMVSQHGFFAGPGNLPQVALYPNSDQRNATQMLPFAGRHVATQGGLLWTADEQKLQCYRLPSAGDATASGDELQSIWTQEVPGIEALIVSGLEDSMRLFCADGDGIQIRDAHTGESLQRLEATSVLRDGDRLRSMAVAASTETQPAILAAVSANGQIVAWSQERQNESSDFYHSVLKPKSGLGGAEAHADSQLFPSDILATAIQQLGSPRGLGLVVDDSQSPERTPSIVEWLGEQTQLNLVVITADASRARWLRESFASTSDYGNRISVLCEAALNDLRFADRLFNLVVHAALAGEFAAEVEMEFQRVLATHGLRVSLLDGEIVRQEEMLGAGDWLHQYGNVGNTASSQDILVGSATSFRLRWFGGVGPGRIPDRHLRGAAPLAAKNTMVIHGDGVLIGVDPANGTERWQLPLPDQAMRYVMPFDAGYSALSSDGTRLWSAVRDEIWTIDALTGLVHDKIRVPESWDALWGYLSEADGGLFASVMRATAPRLELEPTQARENYSNQDYNSARPLVCSRRLMRMSYSGELEWSYDSLGLIPHASISIAPEWHRLVLIEGVGKACREHPTDRASTQELCADALLRCLDTRTGKLLWSRKLQWNDAENILYTQLVGDNLVLLSSRSRDGKAEYLIQVLDSGSGETVWQQQHRHVRDGLYHGEQVHHPLVLLGQEPRLFVEPYIYDLKTGERLRPPGQDTDDWALVRPGHSCGTLSGAGDCVFFRASNPTVFNLNEAPEDAFTALSPSRTGCWINMVPATGLLLIPEGSASCVCNYSLQTSMAFAPVAAGSADSGPSFLSDYPLPEQPKLVEIHAWRLSEMTAGDSLRALTGTWDLQRATQDGQTQESAENEFDGNRYWLREPSQASLKMPSAITVSAWVKLAEENTQWTGIISALEDNGSYERGCLLGLKDDRFVFGIASSSKLSITYLSDTSPAVEGEWVHVAGTYDGSLMRLFVNGKIRAISRAQSGKIAWDDQAYFALGAYRDQNECYPFRGKINRVSIYNAALPPETIRMLADQQPVP